MVSLSNSYKHLSESSFYSYISKCSDKTPINAYFMFSGVFYAYVAPSKLATTSNKNYGFSAIIFTCLTHGCYNSMLSVICLPIYLKPFNAPYSLKDIFDSILYL